MTIIATKIIMVDQDNSDRKELYLDLIKNEKLHVLLNTFIAEARKGQHKIVQSRP